MKKNHQKSIIITIVAFFICIYSPLMALHKQINYKKTCEKGQTKKSTPVASIWQIISKGKRMSMLEKRDAYAHDCKKFKTLNKQIKDHSSAYVKDFGGQDKTIRFMTYNVHFWRGKENEDIIEPVLELLQKINPDVVCLQEVIWKKENKKELTKKFKEIGYKYGGDATFVAGKGALGNIVFSKYPLSDLSSKKYKKPIRKEYRSFTGGTVMFNDEPIRFYCTHLDVWDETGQARFYEMTELTDHIEEDDANEKNVIFMGDFNAVRKDDYDYSVNGKNVWKLLLADDKKRGITTSTKALDLAKELGYKDTFTIMGKRPIFTVWSGKIVDFIFVKPGGNLICKDTAVYYSSISDHLPVIADFSVKKTIKKEKTHEKCFIK